MHGSQLTLQSTFAPVSLSKVLIGRVWLLFYLNIMSTALCLWQNTLKPSKWSSNWCSWNSSKISSWVVLFRSYINSTIWYRHSILFSDVGWRWSWSTSWKINNDVSIPSVSSNTWEKITGMFKILVQINERFPTVETFACKSDMALYASMGWNV